MGWTARERRILAGLRTPAHIQQYLDELDYDEEGGADSPRSVMRTGKAQCFSGVLFACAALRELGHPPRLMYMDAASDDGHCLALYERGGLWGAIAKSNFTTLRSREAIYPYLALGLSYFDGFPSPLLSSWSHSNPAAGGSATESFSTSIGPSTALQKRGYCLAGASEN